MIYGIGTDIVTYQRMEELHQRYGDKFARRILSESEFEEYKEHMQPARMLMKRFAAKEAFAKAIGTGLRHPVSLQAISVAHDELGKPILRFSEHLIDFIHVCGVKHWHLSLSDEREHAVAFVVLERA